MGKGPQVTKGSSGAFMVNGQKLATSNLDRNGQVTSINFNGPQKQIWNTAQKGIADVLGSIGSALAMTPERRSQFSSQLFQPVADTIRDAYGTQRDMAYSRFANLGGLNSLGFNRYNADVIGKNEAKALASAASEADLKSYGLPSLLLQPISQALSLYSGAQNNLFGLATNSAQFANAGQQQSNAYNTANNIFENGEGKSGGGFFTNYMNFIDPLKLMHK